MRTNVYTVTESLKSDFMKSKGWRIVLGSIFGLGLLASLLNPVFALIPLLGLVVFWSLLNLPLDAVMPVFVFIFLAVNNPNSQPGDGAYNFFLNAIGKILFKQLPVKISVFHIVVMILTGRAMTVILLSDRSDKLDRRPPKPFAQAIMGAVGAIIAWEVYGIGTGGNFKVSEFQLILPLLLPCLALAIAVAATDKGIARIRFALLLAGALKAFEAIWAYWFVGLNVIPDVIFVTQHGDSVLWATCVAILISTWFEKRDRKSASRLRILGALYSLAMIANNRRTVWVAIAAGLLFMVVIAEKRVKRNLLALIALTWPLVAGYTVLGLASSSSVFKPVHMIQSVLVQDDASSSTRDIENTNLLITLRAKPLIGWGFGHEYLEVIKADDISKGFPQYRYMPHNSFLGFWAFLGLPGASLYFLPFVVGVFYLASSKRTSLDKSRRSAATWGVCTIIAYLVQAWSDLALQDTTPMIMAAIAIGIGGALGRAVPKEFPGEHDHDEIDATVTKHDEHSGPKLSTPKVAQMSPSR